MFKNQLKKSICILTLAFTLTSCSDEVGDVSLGLFTLKDIKLNSFVDPVVTGVTCHVASIEANLSFSDRATALFHVVRRVKSRQR